MHEKLLLNKNLKIGDYIGNDVDESEWIFGKYKIVGSFTGEGIISIANQNIYYEVLKNEQGAGFDKPTGLVVFPKENRLDAMNNKIENFSRKDCDYITYNTLKKQLDEELASYNTIMTIIILVVVAVISISIGAMVYIIYMNRSEEFGILYAIGYKKTFIYKLIFAEIAIVSVISWALGYLLSYGMFALINLFLGSKGISLYFFSINGFINTLIVPVMVTIFSTIPVLRKLRKWDPVSIIEKR